jgi:type I restriction enzyme M protein
MRQDTGVDGDAQRISQLCWMFFLKIIDDQDQELELIRIRLSSPIPSKLPVALLGRGPGGHHRRRAARLRQRRLFPALKDLPARARPATGGAWSRRVRGRLQLHEVGPADAAGGQQDQRIDFNNLAERQHFGDIYEQILNDLQIGRQRGRVLHAARRHRVHGGPDRPEAGRDAVRSRLRHGRLPHLRHPPHARRST